MQSLSQLATGALIWRSDVLAVCLVWGASVLLATFVTPHTGYSSTPELLYYSVYNVAVGAFVGLYLFDRRLTLGTPFFLVTASLAILCGTLINELFVEPLFGSGPINGEGLYYGLMDALWPAGTFLLLRLVQQQHPAAGPVSGTPAVTGSDANREAPYVVARVAHGNAHLWADDIIYMKAERDFTRVICSSGERFVSENLKNLLAKTGELGLLRTHKSFAVNIRHLDRLTRTEAHLGTYRVPVGRRYWPTAAETWRSRQAPRR